MACAIGSRQTFSVGNAAKRRGKLRLRRTVIAETAKPGLHRRQRIEPAAVNRNRKTHNERSRRRRLAQAAILAASIALLVGSDSINGSDRDIGLEHTQLHRNGTRKGSTRHVDCGFETADAQ